METVSKIQLYADKVCRIVDASALHYIRFDGSVLDMDASQGVDMTTPVNAYKTLSLTDDDYVCVLDYDNIDYDYAYDYFQNHFAPDFIGGACSDVRNGNYFGRNYDFFYDREVAGVVRVPRRGDLLESITVCASLVSFTDDVIRSGKYNDAYKILPFFALDGINENHVFCGMNVVHGGDRGKTVGHQYESAVADLCMLMVPRYVLDHFSTAADAVEALQTCLNVYAPENMYGYELHYMIGDEDSTYVIEYVDNQCVVIDKYPYMTNFYMDALHDLENDKIVRNTDSDENQCGVNKFGIGIERWNTIVDNYSSASTLDGMKNLMRTELAYTRMYMSHPRFARWYTELVSEYPSGRVLTVTSPDSEFEEILPISDEGYRNANRNDGRNSIWHTSHSSVYDIHACKLYLAVQEKDTDLKKEYTFAMNKEYSETVDNLLSALMSRKVTAKDGTTRTLGEWIDKISELDA